MTYTGLPGQQGNLGSNAAVFNPPPGWPRPPAGWDPPPGWQPDPSWPPAPPGWQFWVQSDALPGGQTAVAPGAGPACGAAQLAVSFEGTSRALSPGQTLRIGRGTDNDIVIGYASVSRSHAQVTWTPGGWLFENIGQAPTFLNGQLLTTFIVSQPTVLNLGSEHGPTLRLDPGAGGRPPGATQADWGAPALAPPPGFGQPPEWFPAGPPPYPGQVRQLANLDLGSALRILVPIGSWLHNRGFRQALRLLVIVYALLPLVFLIVLRSSSNLTAPGWVYSLYVAPLWAIAFWWLIRPGRLGKNEIWASVGIALFTTAWIFLVTSPIDDHLGTSNFAAAIGVGFNEEISKALPVLLAVIILLKARKTRLSARMCMYLGTLAGLAFGVLEAALIYTGQAIVGIINAGASLQQCVQQVQQQNPGATQQQALAACQKLIAQAGVSESLQFAERIFVDGLQHAIWAGISAFFIGIALNATRNRIVGCVGVIIAALLHGLNDFVVTPPTTFRLSIWVLIQAFSLFLFIGYTMSAQAIERQVRSTPMFRGESLIMDAIRDPVPGAASSSHGGPLAGGGPPSGPGFPAGWGPPPGWGPPAGDGPPRPAPTR